MINLPVNYEQTLPAQRRLVRLQYVTEQEGKCWFCKTAFDKTPPPEIQNKKINTMLFPDGFFRWPVHLHHSHVTGLTIGAVHSYCNAVLWQYHGE